MMSPAFEMSETLSPFATPVMNEMGVYPLTSSPAPAGSFECPVCQECIRSETEDVVLSCSHRLCKRCWEGIQMAHNLRTECPLCRCSQQLPVNRRLLFEWADDEDSSSDIELDSDVDVEVEVEVIDLTTAGASRFNPIALE